MPDKFDLEDCLKHLERQPEDTIYAKYAREVASFRERLNVLFTENCVLGEISALKVDNRYQIYFTL